MRLPRLSVAGVMALTLIAAFDCVGVGLMVRGLELPTNEINCIRQFHGMSVRQSTVGPRSGVGLARETQ